MVQEQGAGTRGETMSLLLGQPPVQPAPLLDPRINAVGRHVAHRGHDQPGPFAEEPGITGKGQGEGVQDQGRVALARSAGLAHVPADRARSGQQDQCQVVACRQQGGVVFDDLLGQKGQLALGSPQGDAGPGAAILEAPHVVGQAEEPALKRADQVGDRGPQDEPGIVEGKTGLGLGEESAVDPGQGSRGIHERAGREKKRKKVAKGL